MPKLRKLRKKQKFRHNVNRKRVQKSQDKYTKKCVSVDCKTMQSHWDRSKSLKENMADMGLAFDANQVVKVSSLKNQFKVKVEDEEGAAKKPKKVPVAATVADQLEKESASVEKVQTFRFPPDQVRWISHCIDRHGDDFKAMARDPKNIFQETPKQIRQKVKKFVSIPEHFASYCKSRGFLSDEILQIFKESQHSS